MVAWLGRLSEAYLHVARDLVLRQTIASFGQTPMTPWFSKIPMPTLLILRRTGRRPSARTDHTDLLMASLGSASMRWIPAVLSLAASFERVRLANLMKPLSLCDQGNHLNLWAVEQDKNSPYRFVRDTDHGRYAGKWRLWSWLCCDRDDLVSLSSKWWLLSSIVAGPSGLCSQSLCLGYVKESLQHWDLVDSECHCRCQKPPSGDSEGMKPQPTHFLTVGSRKIYAFWGRRFWKCFSIMDDQTLERLVGSSWLLRDRRQGLPGHSSVFEPENPFSMKGSTQAGLGSSRHPAMYLADCFITSRIDNEIAEKKLLARISWFSRWWNSAWDFHVDDQPNIRVNSSLELLCQSGLELQIFIAELCH